MDYTRSQEKPAMSAIPSITQAEWHVMKVLWERQEREAGAWMSAGQIVEPIAHERRIHHRTVRTLLSRLVKKGAVEARPDAAGYRYRARIGRVAVVQEESQSFLARVFDGNAAPALVHLLQESRDRLTPEEVAELRALLNRKGKP
jgi:BlaI family transcriptional regulator, penicillinase repressor